MRVYADPDGIHKGIGPDMADNECILDFEFCSGLRLTYLGLSAFDFENIINIVVEHIIG